MTHRLRETLSLLLIGLLPLHALFITVGTRILAGQDQAPLSILALWKESFLLLIVLLALLEFIRNKFRIQNSEFRIDLVDALIIALILLSVVVTVLTHGNWGLYAYGFKYDFLAMVAFLVLRRVEWSQAFMERAQNVLLWVGALVAAYGLLTLVLPQQFFTWLGYSDLHSIYRPGHPLPAYHQIGGTALRRIQSTLSGPNQLGLWLLIPWSVVWVKGLRGKVFSFTRLRYATPGFKFLVSSLVIGLGILFSFSRAAWISAFIIALVNLYWFLPRAFFRKMGVGIVSLGIVGIVVGFLVLPSLFLRIASSKDHLLRPLEALHTMVEHPFGMGLGTAGPASNRVSDTCMTFTPADDIAWTKERPEICVFVGETQVQPTDRTCRCPVLPENWYLQIGVELGWLGFFAFLSLIFLMLHRLRQNSELRIQNAVPFLSLLGISIASLFLHAWEDSAVAFTLWLLFAVTKAYPELSLLSSPRTSHSS